MNVAVTMVAVAVAVAVNVVLTVTATLNLVLSTSPVGWHEDHRRVPHRHAVPVCKCGHVGRHVKVDRLCREQRPQRQRALGRDKAPRIGIQRSKQLREPLQLRLVDEVRLVDDHRVGRLQLAHQQSGQRLAIWISSVSRIVELRKGGGIHHADDAREEEAAHHRLAPAPHGIQLLRDALRLSDAGALHHHPVPTPVELRNPGAIDELQEPGKEVVAPRATSATVLEPNDSIRIIKFQDL
mmetsp:Transcript_148365/g.413312  ORF Transcript_148365/g.413312 Transcript_148365/m.413312 type:complete len:239 (+) Transcript_148365:540-1256(+)